jgi:hypothetical protein
LIETIRKNVDFTIRSIEIEDRGTKKPVGFADELKTGMILAIFVVPDFRRQISFIMTVRVEGDRTVSRLGIFSWGVPKVERMEDSRQYMDELMGYAEQIVQAINKVSKCQWQRSCN